MCILSGFPTTVAFTVQCLQLCTSNLRCDSGVMHVECRPVATLEVGSGTHPHISCPSNHCLPQHDQHRS